MQSAGEKPNYLGLLNAISLAETNAGVYLNAWADVSPDPDFAACLRLVAARETSHGELFCRRLCELGYALRDKPDARAAARLARVSDPKVSDLAKIGDEREESDPFGDIERDIAAGRFDAMTCNMLTWYIAEERDTGARLREAYACVRAKTNGHSHKANGHAGPSQDAEAIMACMTAGFARLEKSIEKLAKAVK